MPIIAVSKFIAATCAALWANLADFGNIDWIPVAGRVQVEGVGVGMSRTSGDR